MSIESQTSFAPSYAQSPLPLEAPEASPQFIAMVSSPVDMGGGLGVAEVNALSPPLSNLRLSAPAPPNAPHATLYEYASDGGGGGGAPAMYFQQPPLLTQMPSSQMCASYTGGIAVPRSVANVYNIAPQVIGPPSVRASYPVPLPDNLDSLLAPSVAAEGCNNLNSGGNFMQQIPTAAGAPANVGVAGLEDLNEILNGFYQNEAPLPLLQPATIGASLSNQMFVSPHYALLPSTSSFPSNTSTISSQYIRNG